MGIDLFSGPAAEGSSAAETYPSEPTKPKVYRGVLRLAASVKWVLRVQQQCHSTNCGE